MSILQIPFFLRQPQSEQIFTTPGTTNFIVPNDVYFISAVCIGGGGGGGDGGSSTGTNGGGGGALAWVSNLPVSPGENLTINVGVAGTGGQHSGAAGPSRIARGATFLITANGGSNGTNASTTTPTSGGTFTFDASIVGVSGISTGGGVGGVGGHNNSNAQSGGGGGAGGYSGAGGAGGNGSTTAAGSNGTAGSGGGAGGGGGRQGTAANANGADGGGTELYGQGDNGAAGSGAATPTAGGGGSGGEVGDTLSTRAGNYGGGSGGTQGNVTVRDGAQGSVRIIWGPARFYPTTNTDVQVSYATSATSSLSTIIVPSDAQAGDVAFLFDGASNSTTTAPTNVLPSGWTQVSTSLVNDGTTSLSMRSTISYLILDSTDVGTTITGMNATVNRKTMLVFRPNFTVDSLTLSTPTASTQIADVAQQTISLSTAGTPVIGFGHMRATGAITTPTVSAAFTQIQNTTLQYTYYIVDNSVNTLSDVTVDFADSGTNSLISFYATLNGIYS